LAQATRLPLTLSERLATRWGYRELFENPGRGGDHARHLWCGGISEAKKIATAAETHYLPVAPPQLRRPGAARRVTAPGGEPPHLYILESVRRHYADEYHGLVTSIVQPEQGTFPLPPGRAWAWNWSRRAHARRRHHPAQRSVVA